MSNRRGADFDDFVRTRSTALLRTAYLFTGDRYAAEDLLQEVLERVYVRWPGIRGAPEPYVRRALVTRAANRWRRRATRPESRLDGYDLKVTDCSEDVLARDAVLAALRALPDCQRVGVVLRFLEDLPVVDVAQVMGS